MDPRTRFAVVDVESTGSLSPRNRIIEIAIVRVENGEIRGAFSSLIHPERHLPDWIVQLTGIDPVDLETAPTFQEVSKQIRRHLDGAVFVAHNVPFDYNFVRREFERLGESYEAERYCTLQLSRKTLDLPRYRLDDVTDALDIHIKDRHRALGDAMAAARVLIKLLPCPK